MLNTKILLLPDNRISNSLFLMVLAYLLWIVTGLIKILPYQIDDAFITYRYVDNFIRSGQIVFNPNDIFVEGFTSQLWFWLLVAIARVFEIHDVSFCGPVLGIGSFCIAVMTLWFALYKKIGCWPVFIFLLVMLSLPSVPFYAVTGLEELFFAFQIMFLGLCLAGYFRNIYWGILLIIAAVWTRPEAPWIAVMLAIAVMVNKDYN